MEIELRKELFSAAEEEYVSKGYSYEESIEYFQKRYSDAACLAERVNDGEIVDNTNLRFNIEQLIISFKYANQKRQDIDRQRIFNPSETILSDNLVELAIKGNQLLGNYYTSKNRNEYEQGKWFLLNTIY